MLHRGNNMIVINPCSRKRAPTSWTSVRKEDIMHAGQKVRLKAASPLKHRLNLPPGALGAVLCSYGLLRQTSGTRRVDVRFGPSLVVWGVPDDQFETVEDDVAA